MKMQSAQPPVASCTLHYASAGRYPIPWKILSSTLWSRRDPEIEHIVRRWRACKGKALAPQ